MRISDCDGRQLPAIIEGDEALTEVVGAERDRIREILTERGAVLFRGFDVGGVDGFTGAVRLLSGNPLEYNERSSPRTVIKGRVFTSTDYPQNESIFLHNECAYQTSWPLKVYFYCIEPPATLGATPLADIRAVSRLIDAEIRAEFAERGWMHVRNFHPDIGGSWQDFYQTQDRAAVESYCAREGIEVQWGEDDGLRTTAVRRAIHAHPVTSEELWFNHATFFHLSTLAAEYRDGLIEMFGEADVPNSTYYGDGAAIPDEVVEHLRQCYLAAQVRTDWQRDDILLVDNMLAAHGREPYTGQRRIAIAMAEASST